MAREVSGRGGYDAAVVGAGHNGLVAAASLARAGLRVLVLERRDRVGGCADTSELAPGVRGPTLAHSVERLSPRVVEELDLGRYGFAAVEPPVSVFAPHPDGSAVVLERDLQATVGRLRGRSRRDAEALPPFDRRVRALASFVRHLHAAVPPDLGRPGRQDLLTLLRLGRALRRLGPRAARELLRVLPMAVADLVEEAFEDDALRAVIALPGVLLTSMGPRSAGTAAVLLAAAADAGAGALGRVAVPLGGPGALARALEEAARSHGAEVRTGAEVVAVTTDGERATGVALATGEEVRAGAVLSAVDPRRTLLELVDPSVLGPTLRWRAEHIRATGSVAKVNLALRGLPRFPAAGEEGQRLLRGRILLAPDLRAVERAARACLQGRLPDRPVLEATVPTLSDPSLAPEGGHVLSVLVQYVPYRLREGEWDRQREALGDLALGLLEECAPGLSSLVTARQVLTPVDLERGYGLTGGHPLHAEPGLDQFFAWRPLLGQASYRLAVRGLYLCGAGAHPGGGVTGWPGRNAARVVLADLRRR
ncbi:MAG TPA: NAD(P)/FAD-dependent oxidoreductase [Actinomycetota bacterium]|nr:NAD(P)/FAD-dependent oxidoreductase [Actinomycetota bacterium]